MTTTKMGNITIDRDVTAGTDYDPGEECYHCGGQLGDHAIAVSGPGYEEPVEFVCGNWTPNETSWQAHGPGYAGRGGGYAFSISTARGPATLSYHRGDGNWVTVGTYPGATHAALAARDMAAAQTV